MPPKNRIAHTPANNRYDSLDSLRAVACFLVIWQHVSESFLHLASSGQWASATANYVDFGRIGVVAFFCISGFVIPSSLKGNRIPAIKAFLVHRFFRLYPIYWVALAIGAYVLWYIPGTPLPTSTLLANIAMGAVFTDQPHIQGLFWTLEIELVFYLASALLYLAFGRYKLVASIVGFTIAHYVWKHDLLQSYPGNLPMLAYFLAIMFTAATFRGICDLHSDPLFSRSETLKIAAKIICALLVYLVARPVISGIEKSFINDDPVWHKYGWGHTLGLALFALFYLVKRTPKWLAVAGRSTYSAYLLHAIVFTLLQRLWETQNLPHTRLEVYILLTTLITFAVATLSYRYLEKPAIRLSKRLA